MKTVIHVALLVGLVFVSRSALAGSMECGGQIFEGGQLQAPSKSAVLAACGEPTARDGDNWIYKREGQFTNVLHFNDSGELEAITQQPSE